MSPDVDDEFDVFDGPLDGIRLIEASAGTGKTWNLCGLVLRLLLERPLELPQILVVTYTKAAAAELRERIRQRLMGTLEHLRGAPAVGGDPFVPQFVATLRRRGHDDSDLIQRLSLALAGFDEASIFTIHAFCQRALADAPFTALMPLATELLHDDSELVQSVANDFWRRRVASGSLQPWLAGWLLHKADTPERFAQMLRRQQARPTARAHWPAAIDDVSAPDFATLAAAHAVAQQAWHEGRAAALAALHGGVGTTLHKRTYTAEWVDAAAAAWDELLSHDDVMATIELQPARLELFGAALLQDKTLKGKTTPAHPFFNAAQAVLDARAAVATAADLARLRLLRELLEEGGAELRRAKQQRHVMSFDDLLGNLQTRLTGAAGAALQATLRRRFPAALIDEFQDTDPLQWSIFETIYSTAESTLFLIGDPKQAIYGFRNADLPTYLRARASAATTTTLRDNQRSTAPLLAGLNHLFTANPQVFMQPGLVYRTVQAGAKPRPVLLDRSAPSAALTVWQLPKETDSGAPLPRASAQAAVPVAVAGEIARLLGAARRGDITLDGRPLRAGDIAVLVRSHADGGAMRQALAVLGVGCVELAQASVFHSSDAEDLERLLAAVIEPGHSGLVKAALAGVAMGFDAPAIHALGDDEAAMLDVVQRLVRYRQTWLQQGIGVMLRQWLAEDQVATRLLSRSDGERRLTNLLHLAELLHQAASEHVGPEALHRWLQEQRRSTQADEAAQLRLESDQNLVQIVTIHKSKGLEFPIVFCPTLWKAGRSAGGDGLPGVEYHDDDGQAVVDFRKGFAGEFDEDGVKARRNAAAAAEWLRLAYVALTRAIHRCVLVQGVYAGRQGSTTESSRGLLHWMVAGAGSTPAAWFKHAIAVSDIEAAWQRWAAAAGSGVALVEMPAGPWAPLAPDAVDAGAFAALPPPLRMPAAQRTGSYSALIHQLDSDRAAADHDVRVDAPVPAAAAATEAPPVIADDDILRFPRGAAAGVALHAVFEHADFADRSSWPAAIARGLQGLRPGTGPVAAAGQHESMLTRLLADVLATPLPVGTARPLQLADVPRQRRLAELEFLLPAERLDATTLNRWLADHGQQVPTLAFATLAGWFKGVIDLVVEHDGRWFVIDWKSNHLGDQPADYGPAPLAQAMTQHAYHLQALLYAVALHRLLRWRLPGYTAQQHFGGVIYLFVRGVRPGWADADGRPTGLVFERPAPALIESLSALFDTAQEPA